MNKTKNTRIMPSPRSTQKEKQIVIELEQNENCLVLVVYRNRFEND